MRVPDFPGSNQGAGTYTREQPDLEDIKRVEIIRGPASALYGSDAIGGVVAYTTKDPGDYLDATARTSTAASRAPTAAPTSCSPKPSPARCAPGNLEFLGIYTRRDGQQFKPAQSSLGPNPTTWYNNDFLAKLVIRPTDVDTIRITGGYTQGKQSTQVLSGVGNFPSLFARVYRRMGPGLHQHLPASAPNGCTTRRSASSTASTSSPTSTRSTPRPTPTSCAARCNGVIPTNGRTSQFYFNQNVSGAELQLNTDAQVRSASAQLLHLRPELRLHHHDPAAQPPADHAGDRRHDPDGRRRDLPQQELPRHRDRPGRRLHPGRDHRVGRPADRHAGGAARLLQPQPQPRQATSGTRPAPRSNIVPTASTYVSASPKLGVALSLHRQLLGLLPVCDGLPRAALRQRQLRLHQRRVVLPDPAQRQPEARDGEQLRGRLARQVRAAARAGSSPASTISTTTSSRRSVVGRSARSPSSSTST